MNKTMEDYISETAETLSANIDNRRDLTKALIGRLKKEKLDTGKTIVFVASGSSYNAVQSALMFMNKYLKNTVRLISPFAFCYYENIIDNNIYLFVSQSGCSTNIVEAVKKYQQMGGYAFAILGNCDTTLAKLADAAAPYGVGEETVGYVTKGVTTLTGFCMITALELAAEGMDKAAYEDVLKELKTAASNHFKVYEQVKTFCRTNEKAFLAMEHVILMGGGANMGTIREGALKLAEMLHIQTTYYEAEEFIHGPNLQVTPQYTLFFVDGQDAAGKRVKEIQSAAKEITDKSFLISASEWNLVQTDETLTPLYLTAFFQYLACWAARELDINGEHPFYKRFKEHVQNKTADYQDDNPF